MKVDALKDGAQTASGCTRGISPGRPPLAEIFETAPGYFERYYEGDPFYQPGDTLGAWDDDNLVSAVHLCRRPVVWEGGSLLCGGIANVATLPEFRRQGLSRRLLAEVVAKMEQENFDFSLLGTGVPDHYAALGWAAMNAPRAVLTLHPQASSTTHLLKPLMDEAGLDETYRKFPRPLQFHRPRFYFDRWVCWNWDQENARRLAVSNGGYTTLVIPDDAAQIPFLSEWRAADAASELTLLQAAAGEARNQGQTALGLEGMPQHLTLGALEELGTVAVSRDDGSMLRRINLPQAVYDEVKEAYQSGRAVWWPGDGF